MSDPESLTKQERGYGLMLSYRELVTLNTTIAEIKAKLEAFLVLRADVDSLFARVRQIELTLASAHGGGKVMTAVLYGGVSLVAALIGAVAPSVVSALFHH